MKLLDCSAVEFNRTDNRNKLELDCPPGTTAAKAFSLPRVAIIDITPDINKPRMESVAVIAASGFAPDRPLFLWCLYRHMFKEDDGLPRMCMGHEDRNVSMEEIVQMVRDGKLHERAIPAAMELLL